MTPVFAALLVACGSDPSDTASTGETEQSMGSATTPDDSDDSNDAAGRRLEVSLSFDSFSTDTFTCLVHEGNIIFGVTMGTSDAGEAFQIAGQMGADDPQQISINLGSEVWEVSESDDAEEQQVGMFLELEVDVERGTVRGRAAVEERSYVDSDGTDTLTFDIRC